MFLFAEGALRILGISYPYFTQIDDVTGFSLRPNAEGWQMQGGKAYVKINSVGMRDREHVTEKPANTFRIAVLGDSYAEARQVDEGETFWGVMEQELKTCPALKGKTPEVLNFGVSGFGTTQESLLLQSGKVSLFDPDFVLLAFTTGNDIVNNSKALEGNTQKPYFTLQNGELILDDSFRSTEYFLRQKSAVIRAALWLHSHSRVLQLLNRAWVALRSAPATPVEGTKGFEQGIDRDVYMTPKDPRWTEAWNITEQILLAMQNQMTGWNMPFAVATLSSGIQVYPEKAVREEFMKMIGVTTLFYPDERIAAFGKANSLPVLTIAPLLQHLADTTGTFFHGFANTKLGEGHWNEAGHDAAGKEMAKFVCEKLIK
jgi:hypothetical protein